MADMSFSVNYTKTKVNPPSHPIEYEKCFLTLSAALNFCVQLADQGGEALYIIQFVRRTEDGILEGAQLAEAIDRQRVRLAIPSPTVPAAHLSK
jgi:hypothetical protein